MPPLPTTAPSRPQPSPSPAPGAPFNPSPNPSIHSSSVPVPIPIPTPTPPAQAQAAAQPQPAQTAQTAQTQIPQPQPAPPQFATAPLSSSPDGPTVLLTAPPAQVPVQLPPTALHALPPRTTSAPRFSHRRRGGGGSGEPALSSEGGARARFPTSHAHTPSGGSIPANNIAPNGNTQLPVYNSNSNPNGHSTGATTGPAQPGHQSRRQGKPIFEWFKGKLGARRSSDADHHSREAVTAANANNGKKVVNGKPQPPPPVVVQSLAYRPQPSPSPLQSPASPPLRSQLSPPDIFRRDSVDSGHLTRTETMSMRSYSMSFTNVPSERRRELNNPYPSLPIRFVRRSYPASTIDTESRPASMSYLSRSRTSSLVSLSSLANRRPQISVADDDDSTRESLRYSGLYADEDASVRPIPPSPTRSMSIISTRFGSEALIRSDSIPRRVPGSSPPLVPDRRDTFSSMGCATSTTSDEPRSRQNSLASTKPTTVMSFDSSGPPIAHIAVASPSISSSSPPVGAARSISSPSGATSTAQASSPVSPTFLPPAVLPPDDVRVPRHTRYHPRNNPHPTSPPGPDASTVTLASSTFALNTERQPRPSSLRSPTSTWHGNHSTSPTVAFAEGTGGSMCDGLSTHALYDGVSTHALSLNARSRGYGRCDDDASMRAIRRRGSWESAESRWSWRPGNETASMFAALGRSTETDEGVGTGTNRSSTYTRESFRTAYSAWTQPGAESENGELNTLTSESALVPHRPVSVRV